MVSLNAEHHRMNFSEDDADSRRVGSGLPATHTRTADAASLDPALLRWLIAKRIPGGISELQDRWMQSPGQVDSPDAAVPHRSTIHRWSTGQVPRTATDLLQLCSVLDIDPLCLLTLPQTDPDLAVEKLMSAYVHGRWQPPALEFLTEFLGRRAVWPPQALSRRFFGRDWFTAELEHDTSKAANFYATFRISAVGEGPFVYHFAFRHSHLFARRWLQFGFVVRQGENVNLRHINGHVDTNKVPKSDSPTLVQTWFGPGPACFRVACLHPFSLNLDPPGTAEEPAVRFPG